MRFLPLLAAAMSLSAGIAARAESLNFSFGNSASAFSGSGIFTTGTLEALGEYSIATVTGSAATAANGPTLAISSILAPGVFPTPTNGGSFPANDNTLFVTNGLGTLSQDGVSFILSNGAQINLYNDGPGDDAFLERAGGGTVSENVAITITPVAATPEPSSFALLGTGLLGIASVLKRRSA